MSRNVNGLNSNSLLGIIGQQASSDSSMIFNIDNATINGVDDALTAINTTLESQEIDITTTNTNLTSLGVDVVTNTTDITDLTTSINNI